MTRTAVTENRKMQKYIRGKVKEKRLAGQHIRRGEGKLIKRMRNVFIEADKARCPFPRGARRFFQINTAIQVIVFRLLFATITLPHRSGYRLQAGRRDNRLLLQPNLLPPAPTVLIKADMLDALLQFHFCKGGSTDTIANRLNYILRSKNTATSPCLFYLLSW